MKSIRILLPIVFLWLVFRVEALRAQQKPEHLFYYVDNEQSFKDLREHADKVSIVSPAWFSLDDDGIVWGSVDPRVIELAKNHQMGVMPLIVNTGFDQLVVRRFVNNEVARRRAIVSIADLCRAHGLMGIQIDIENLHIIDRESFTRFYRETAEALHQQGFKLSVAVVHRPEEYAGPTPYHKWLFKNWRAGYDLAELAKAGDFLSVMTYSQHTRRTTPGPCAGIPWVKQVVEYFLTFVPREKLSLGIPLESMHWYTALDTAGFTANAHSWSRSLDYESAVGVLNRFGGKMEWNETQRVPFAVIENAGLFEHIYFEDARSFKSKYDLLKTYRLRGFSAWVLGAEDPAIWNSMPRVSR